MTTIIISCTISFIIGIVIGEPVKLIINRYFKKYDYNSNTKKSFAQINKLMPELIKEMREDKKEFLADVSSFANALGGDLIIGIIEENGIPIELVGLKITNLDEEIRKIESIIRDGITPKIPNINIKSIQLNEDKYILVIRIGKSWISPHRITYKGYDKFFTRHTKGKFQMDVSELRIAFNLSETMSQRIHNFRNERLGRLVANDTPIPFDIFPKIVIHLIPYSAFDTSNYIDINTLKQNAQKAEPIYYTGWSQSINFDGVIQFSNSNGLCRSYTQYYKSGIIEAVNCSILSPWRDSENAIPSIDFEKGLIQALEKYLIFYRNIEVATPIFLFMSVIGAKGYTMACRRMHYFDYSCIDRDMLIIPEFLIEDINITAENALKPCFDYVWNACGYDKSPYFDENGKWQPSN